MYMHMYDMTVPKCTRSLYAPLVVLDDEIFLAMFVFQTHALFIEIRLDWIQTCHFPRFWTLIDGEEFWNSCININDLGF